MKGAILLNRSVFVKVFFLLCSIAIFLAEVSFAEEKPAVAALAELVDKAKGVKPYYSEYQLTGPNGELKAEIAVGNEGRILVHVSHVEMKATIMELWSDDGKRIFFRQGNAKTVCVTGVKEMMSAVEILDAALSGGEPREVRVMPFIHIGKSSLQMGIGAANHQSWMSELRDQPETIFELLEKGAVRVTSVALGEIVADGANGLILEQTHGPRKMHRIKHDETNALAIVNELVKSKDPGPYDLKNLRGMGEQFAMNLVVQLACQDQIHRVERGDDTVEKLQKRLAAHADQLAEGVIPGIYDGVDGPLRNETIDRFRDEALNQIRANILKQALDEKQADREMKQVPFLNKIGDMLAKKIIANVDKLDDEKQARALSHIISGKLVAASAEGLKARTLIAKALIEAQIKSSVKSSMIRYQRNLKLD